MTYELAKQLKEAGFPFKWDAELMELGTGYMYPSPTLEELIEACGEPMFINSPWGSISVWRASGGTRCATEAQGSTPTEAVARLWLALNKK